jgi:hypothetical protein
MIIILMHELLDISPMPCCPPDPLAKEVEDHNFEISYLGANYVSMESIFPIAVHIATENNVRSMCGITSPTP